MRSNFGGGKEKNVRAYRAGNPPIVRADFDADLDYKKKKSRGKREGKKPYCNVREGVRRRELGMWGRQTRGKDSKSRFLSSFLRR